MQTPYAGLRRGLLAAAVLFALPATAQVDSKYDAEPSSDAYRAAPSQAAPVARGAARLSSKEGPMARLDGPLRNIAQNPRGARRGGTVAVTAVAKSAGDLPALRSALARLGFQPSSDAPLSVSGRIPASAVTAMARIPSLRSAHTVQAITRRQASSESVLFSRVGSVTGEASRALRADEAREAFGVDGSGVCIGVMSDSYDNLGGAAAGVASGDLPDNINVIDDLDGGGSDEGRAMMELAFDVAPGVDFAFHNAFEGIPQFAGGIVQLFQAGCDVIVDDIGYSTDPMFQDGLIAQAIDYVVSQGATYYSSAGNSTDASYESDYRPSGQFDLFGELHDFDPGPGVDPFQDIVVGPGQLLRFTFQFDEPSIFASVDNSEFPDLYGGASGQSPTSDYDLVLLDAPNTDSSLFLDTSLNSNNISGVPQEFIEFFNESDEPVTVYLTIQRFLGEESRRMKYINFGGSTGPILTAEYVEPGTSTTFGHSNAEGAFATGAAAWFNTAAFNASVAANPGLVGEAIVESFTSFGGLDLTLDEDGNRLASPVMRMKPDATGSDGDNNTFFGQQLPPGLDPNPSPNFFGTSAAAPNVAAVAALVVEAAGGSIAPDAVYAALETTAADILGPVLLTSGAVGNKGAGPGFDFQTGFGLVRADLAVAAVADDVETIACSPEAPLFFADFDADGTDDTFGEFAQVGNDGDVNVDLSTCAFAAFDPFTERVTYAAPLDAVVAADGEFTIATENGDLALPAGSIPDGPGAIVLVQGDAEVGDMVSDVLGRVVASVVYRDDDSIFGSVRGGGDDARTARSGDEAFLDALERARAQAVDGPVDLTLVASPNPVSGRLAVAFGVAEAAPVRASVYDALGREVAVLADRSFEGGRHELALDASAMPSGVYVVRVIVGGDAQTKQVTVVR